MAETHSSKTMPRMPPSPHAPPILLTGFEPFGGHSRNPSDDVGAALDGAHIARRQVVYQRLPCEFRRSLDVLDEALLHFKPMLVVALGMAENRREITVERVAINVSDARFPDNAGVQPVDQPVVADGPDAYFSTLPIKAMVSAMQAGGIAASVSDSAGTYVCNHLFYGLQHRFAQTAVRSGFVHLPMPGVAFGPWPADRTPSLSRLTDGVRMALAAAADRILV
jgi:pyroglutamyl-peptidase